MRKEEIATLPRIAVQYLNYLSAIKSKSDLTVLEYASDLRTFFRFLKIKKNYVKPDTLFKNCLETADFIQLNDTIEILPNDVERVFAVSYADWQNDSTRFVWVGDGEARVWLAETMCAFEPSLVDPFVWTYFERTSS